MRGLVSSFALVTIALSGSAAADSASGQWCSRSFPGRPGEWVALPQADVLVVDFRHLDVAANRLRRSSVAAITPAVAREFTGRDLPRSSRYYLVRAGILSPAGSSRAAYHAQAMLAPQRFLFWKREDRRLLIVTMQMEREELQAFNIPVVVAADVNPAAASAVCQSAQ